MKAFDVPPAKLVQATVAEFDKQGIKMPDWAVFVKTGPSKERAPNDKNWWNYRLASVLYRIYKDGPVGTQRLRTYYGSKKNRGVRPHAFFKAGGKIIRASLQELEKQGLVQKQKTGGRIIAPKGQSFLDKMAKEALKIMKDEETYAVERKAEKAKYN